MTRIVNRLFAVTVLAFLMGVGSCVAHARAESASWFLIVVFSNGVRHPMPAPMTYYNCMGSVMAMMDNRNIRLAYCQKREVGAA